MEYIVDLNVHVQVVESSSYPLCVEMSSKRLHADICLTRGANNTKEQTRTTLTFSNLCKSQYHQLLCLPAALSPLTISNSTI